MPGLTSRLKLPWTKLEDGADIEVATKPLAEALDNAMLITLGTALPGTVGPAGNGFLNTNTGVFYISNGTAWVPVITGGTLPIGAVQAFATTGVVDADGQVRWLQCNGNLVSRTEYATLYARLGGASSPWGQGNGSTTFGLPDLRGRVPVGVDAGVGQVFANNTLGAKGGDDAHALSVAEMPPHDHRLNQFGSGAATNNAVMVRDGSGSPHGWFDLSGSPSAQYDQGVKDATITTVGGGQAHNNMQPYTCVNYFIKAKY